MRLWPLLLGIVLGAPAGAQSVTIATTGTFPPHLWEEGEIRGFDIDLMDEICLRNGWDCTYRIYALMPALEAIARGEADVALGGLGISSERETFGDFTCPYEQGGLAEVPIFARDASVDPATARIAVLADSLSHGDLDERGYTAVPFDDLASAITSTLAGDTDAFLGNRNSLELVDGASDQLTVIGTVETRSAGAAFLVSHAQPRLLTAINDTLSVLNRDGQLDAMAAKWYAPGAYDAPDYMADACGPVMTASASAFGIQHTR